MKALRWFPALAALGLAAAPQDADTAGARIRAQLKDEAVAGGWIYDDIPRGFAEAARSGKPLLVVFR